MGNWNTLDSGWLKLNVNDQTKLLTFLNTYFTYLLYFTSMLEYSKSYSASIIGKQTRNWVVIPLCDKILFPHRLLYEQQ